jgi:aminoglycoside phosphotransferase (APT) family kinase protein
MSDNLGERFETFLAVVEPQRGAKVASCEAITGGYSRLSARASVTWDDGATEMFILRADPPPGSGVFTSDRDAEVRLLRSLPSFAPVRTPVVRWYDDTGEHLGSSCLVMEAELGASSLQDLMAAADDVAPFRDLFVDTFASLHTTALDRLPAQLPRPADWSSYLDGVLAGYDRMADSFPSAAPVLRHVRWWASTHRPPPVPLALTHGDCQPSNVLVRDGASPLVIDFEFAHIGDPREDIGYYTQIPLPPNVYWTDPEAFLARYRERSGLTEEQLNPEVADYFLMIGMANLLEQLQVAAAAIGNEERPGILANYLINAISHQYDMFLAICERLS